MQGRQLVYYRTRHGCTYDDGGLELTLLDIEENYIFEDVPNSKDANLPELQRLMGLAKSGDTVHVQSLGMLGHSTKRVGEVIKSLRNKGATIIIHEQKMVFPANSNTFIHDGATKDMVELDNFKLVVRNERRREGVQVAKKEGRYKGRKPEMTDEMLSTIRQRIAAGETKTKIAKDLSISRDTLHRYIGKGKPKKEIPANRPNVDVIKLVKKYSFYFHQQYPMLDDSDIESMLNEVIVRCLNTYDDKQKATFETYFRKSAENRMKDEVNRVCKEGTLPHMRKLYKQSNMVDTGGFSDETIDEHSWL